MVIVLCASRAEQAPLLAETLVGERLAACVNIVPGVRSVYRWQGKVCVDDEHLLIMKTTADRVGALSERLRVLHDYDTPEIVVVPVDQALSDPRYVAWVGAMTTQEEPA